MALGIGSADSSLHAPHFTSHRGDLYHYHIFFCFNAFLSILDTPIYIQTEKQPYTAIETFA